MENDHSTASCQWAQQKFGAHSCNGEDVAKASKTNSAVSNPHQRGCKVQGVVHSVPDLWKTSISKSLDRKAVSAKETGALFQNMSDRQSFSRGAGELQIAGPRPEIKAASHFLARDS